VSAPLGGTVSAPRRVAVFVSGSGTNLQALLDRFLPRGPDRAAEIVCVVSDRPGIGALERAARANVPAHVVAPRDHPDAAGFADALLRALRAHRAEFVVLAGYLRLVPAPVVEAYRDRMINIHPGPLPAFGGPGLYGRRVHEAVLAAGLRVTGPTVHFVDERYDTGPIIAQWPVPVRADDTPETLAERVLRAEHRILPEVLAALVRGEIAREPDGRVRTPFDRAARERGFCLCDEAQALDAVRRAFRPEG
jgi:formyltetrahydrofolate-dependent phosphoribosylglycinamide formyltransferase